MRHRPFPDRREAGRQLAAQLGGLGLEDPVVIGLPRGGMVVAFEVARSLRAPLDVVCVRKITAPDEPELGLGAVDEDGGVVLNRRLVAEAAISEDRLLDLVRNETEAVAAHAARYRTVLRPLPLEGRTVTLVDDGLTTGITVSAAA